MSVSSSEPWGTETSASMAWPRLLGAVGAAADVKLLVLAAFGLLLTRLGWLGLDVVFGLDPGATWDRFIGPGFGVIGLAVADVAWTEGLAGVAWSVTAPIRVLIGPLSAVLSMNQGNTEFLRGALAGLWAVLIWGFVGGAMARIAVSRAAGCWDSIGLISALRFAEQRLLALLMAPLGPLLALALLALPGALIGLLAHFGTGVGSLLLPLPLILAVAMALLLIGLMAGWPLMVLTVAAEGEDEFEAISRSYSYVQRRLGRYVLALLIVWALGIVGFLFVGLFAAFVVRLAYWSMAWGGPDELIAAWPSGLSGADSSINSVLFFWLAGVGLLVQGWVFSYFWSAFARIYLMLRQAVDGTPWSEIATDQPIDEPSFLPEPSGSSAAPASESTAMAEQPSDSARTTKASASGSTEDQGSTET